MDEFCGYGVRGYGATPIEAIVECKKGYDALALAYRKYWVGNEEWATFESAITYFDAHIKTIAIPSFGIYGNEDYITENEVLKIYNKERKENENKLQHNIER